MSALASLKRLIRPAVPEPIAPSTWRGLERTLVWLPLALSAANLTGLLLREVLRPAYLGYLALNVPGHLLISATNAVALTWARTERAHRIAVRISIFLLLWTSVVGLLLDLGAVTGFNIALTTIVIMFARVLLDSRLGLFAMVTGQLLSAVVWGGQILGLFDRIHFLRGAPTPLVSGELAIFWMWSALFCMLAWILSSYAANRFSEAAHAVELERVAARRTIAQALMQAGHGRLTGTTLAGKYRLKELLGRGGMGEVYDAERAGDARAIAVKVLFPHLAELPKMLERFAREAEAARRLSPRCTAEVLDVGVAADETHYIVMERLRGEDLASALRRRGHLPPQEALLLVEKLAAVLDAAHDESIVHRDLKPQNIFLVDGSDVRLLDFGIARLLDTPDGRTLTADAAVLGSPGFLAPEQARGASDDVGPHTDVFALGAILYRALTGHNAFPARQPASAIYEALHHRPTRPSRVRAELPPQVDAVLALALAKEIPLRYRRASELARDLALAIEGRLPEDILARAERCNLPADVCDATISMGRTDERG